MNTIDIFKPENILFLDAITTKEECLKAIAMFAKDSGMGNDMQAMLDGFLDREKECTTGFGDGFAIPHTRCSAVKKPGIIVVKSTSDMEWQAMDEQPVQVAIALLVPDENAGTLHMQLLSSLSRKLINKTFKEQLRAANTTAVAYQIINDALVGK